ncbi:MAG: nicotinic acid mononucleotide adenylyltransferase [Patescibacteria group bacterium]|nr:nicotinic acid mononucleotide adenylyltransferase [Patescibacteria group bacterium]
MTGRPAIGLLTGTFDPVHLGHVALARAAMRECDLAEVWLLVNVASAHKAGVTAYEHRRAMAELAVAGEPGLRVEDYRGLHTMAGFAQLMARYPDERFVFIVGMDTIGRLDSWEGFEFVVRNTSFAVAQRPGTGDELAALRGRLGDELGTMLDARVFTFADHTEASSRQAREALRRGEQSVELDERVREYVRQQGLYR